MKSLKIRLQSNSFYILLGAFALIYILIFTVFIRYESHYIDGDISLEVKVIKQSYSDNKISFTLEGEESFRGTYYLKENESLKIKIGDTLLIEGKMSTPLANTIPNTFNYQKYLYNNKIYKTVSIKRLEVLDSSDNLFVKIKNFIYERCAKNEYLMMFICGDKTGLDDKIYEDFKNCGVAHLLAISGMHVSVFVLILTKLLKRVKDDHRKVFISLFLLFYSYIVDFTASIMRVVLFYILSFILDKLDIKISSFKRLLLVAFILIMFNPFVVYGAGFQYSFITAYSIMLSSKFHKKNYFVNIIIISFFALLFTLPITVQMNYEINLITFVSNLILIPMVSYYLYPFALLYFIFPFLENIFVFSTSIMEKLISALSSFDIFVINIPRLSPLIIILFYLLLYLFVYYTHKRYLFLLMTLLIVNKLGYKLDNNYYAIFFDVGQGDSSVLISPYQKDVVMIDTGGIVSFTGESSYNVSDNVILYLKSIGITSLDLLVLTHGDYDHMGESENIIDKLKVEEVSFNKGEYNYLESKLIKALDKENIPYHQNINEFTFGDTKLYFLQSHLYDNENDNSSIIYAELRGIKLLLMGDAGIDAEEDIIEKYNLNDIDILKVGHHGSKTSTGKEFINEINPKCSVVQVGRNNIYRHPNSEVLDNLKDTKLYRTDIEGSVMFKINNKLAIEAYKP